MSRSNGPSTQPAGRPQQRPAAGAPELPDPQARNADQQGRWPPQHAQAPQPHAQHGYAPAHQPGYGQYPGAPQSDPQDYPHVRTQPPAYSYPPPAEQPNQFTRPARGSGEVTGPPPQPAYSQASSYAPQFDPYTPPGAPVPGGQAYGGQISGSQAAGSPSYGYPGATVTPSGHAAGYAPHYQQELSSLQRGPGIGSGYVAAHPPEPAPYSPAELRGPHYEQSYDQWQQPALESRAVDQLQPDPRGYDFGGYMPALAPEQPRRIAPMEPAQSEWAPAPEFQHGRGAHQEPQFDIYGQPRYQPAGHGDAYGHVGGHVGGQFGGEVGGLAAGYYETSPQDDQVRGGQLAPTYQQDPNHQDDEGVEYEIEQPKAGRRWGLIAAALIGAIALGSGATYGYKLLVAPGGKPASAPIVKNDGAPAKVKPAEPGGKQFAHTDSKIMGRLNDNSGSSAPASTSSDAEASGSRKVQTVVVRPDGSILPPATPVEQPRPQAAAISVPGLTIVDGFAGRPTTLAPAAAVTAAPPAAAPATATARPVVANPPSAPAAPAAAAAPSVAPAAPVKPVVVAKAPPPAPDATQLEPQPAPKKAVVPKKPVAAALTAPATATGGNGFVAVLASVPASQKSSMDALKQFADLQQKFGPTLLNKTPEVREANLGDKGTYHRLLVGPPGSREQAGQLCTELKAAGYGSCWVTAY